MFHIWSVRSMHEKQIASKTQTTEDIYKSERIYHSFFEHALDSFFIIDGNSYLYCNQAALTLFELDENENIIGKTPMDYSPEFQPDGQKSSKKAHKKIEKAFEGEPQMFEWVHKSKKGREFPTLVSLNVSQINGKPCLLSMVKDNSKQKETVVKLEKTLQENRYLLEKLKDRNSNTYQVIWNLINLKKMYSGAQSEIEAFSNDINNHIQALFIVQQRGHMIAEKEYINLADFIKTYTDMHSTALNIETSMHIETQLDDVDYTLENAFAFATLFCEILTQRLNAPYQGHIGHVTVSLKNTDTQFVLKIRDNSSSNITLGAKSSLLPKTFISFLVESLNGEVIIENGSINLIRCIFPRSEH